MFFIPGGKHQGLIQLRLGGHKFRAGSLLRRAQSVFMSVLPCTEWGKAEAVIRLSYETAFAAALMTVLNLLVFSFEASHSNSFGKAFIRFGAFVKLGSQQNRWIGNRSFLFFFQIAWKILVLFVMTIVGSPGGPQLHNLLRRNGRGLWDLPEVNASLHLSALLCLPK